MYLFFIFTFWKGNNEIHDKFFKKMDEVREKQEKIARDHFEKDSRLTAAK